jgi:predicted nucleic acid-binding protein
MRIYIESTIPSYVVARPARDLLQAARQQITRDWWETERHRYELFTSEIVLDEIGGGEPAMAQQRLKLLADVKLLELSPDARALTKSILQADVLPAKATNDATHIALATTHEIDILLTWNLRHIANVMIKSRLQRLARRIQLELPILSTPEELMEIDRE